MKLLLLALAILLFPAAQQQIDPCALQPSAFPPPQATNCEPPGVMNWNCVLDCDENYKKAMSRAHRIHCYRTQAAVLEYQYDLLQCTAAYNTCIFEAQLPESECASIRDQCTYEAGQAVLLVLDGLDAAKAAAEATATATHAGCTATCCKQV